MLKKNEKEILRGLMADPKGSDRNVANGVGVTQPTVSRIRQNFLKRGIIESFEVVPGLEELGFEIIAFSRVGSKATNAAKDARVVYAVRGIIMGTKIYRVEEDELEEDVLVMSVHQNYTDYTNFARKYAAEPVFLTITSATPTKSLSFKDIPL